VKLTFRIPKARYGVKKRPGWYYLPGLGLGCKKGTRGSAYEAALKSANVKFESYIYPGTQHGFNNDTTPRYSRDAATLAWQRTIDHFKKHLITT